MSALVLACPLMPQPPSGDSLSSTHVRARSVGSCCCVGNDGGEFVDHAELLVPVEDADWGENLDAHVVGVAVDVRDRCWVHLVDERGGVVREQGQVGDLLPAHDRGGELLGERVRVAEGPCGGVDVDHGHQAALVNVCRRKSMAGLTASAVTPLRTRCVSFMVVLVGAYSGRTICRPLVLSAGDWGRAHRAFAAM